MAIATSKARKAALFLFLLLVLLAGRAPTVRAQLVLPDGFDPNANGTIDKVIVQPDGKILIGGDFTTLAPNGGPAVTRNHIARLNLDGTLDTGFNPNSDNVVNAFALQGDGKILVGGWFDSIGGLTRHRVARLDSATGLPDSFDPNLGTALINTIAIQADGKILVGGHNLISSGGEKRSGIARIDPVTGQTDSFDPNVHGAVISIVVQPDGRILVAGSFTEIGGQMRNGLARLNPTTGLADSFNPDARHIILPGVVVAIAVQADGKILASGNFGEIGGQPRLFMARLDPVTGLADSFNPNPSSFVDAIALQTDGKILVGGYFSNIGGHTRNCIARLDSVSGVADSFDPDADEFVRSIAVQADGKILAVGGFTTLAPNGGAAETRNRIARLETDGRLDRIMGNIIAGGEFATFLATAVQPDGKILIGGAFSNVLGVPRRNIARLHTDGTLDTGFNPDADGNSIQSIAVQPDGKILVSGNFFNIGGEPRNGTARIGATTGLADSFDPNANGPIDAFAVQPDGKIWVGGAFTSIGGQPHRNFARLDATTGLADSIPDANNSANSIAVLADGKIVAGGFFSTIGGQTRFRIGRVDGATGLADSFNPRASDFVKVIAVQSDGKFVVGGDFLGENSIGGQARNHIARVDGVTGLADSFDPNANNVIESITVQADGKVIAGGQFQPQLPPNGNSIGGRPRHFLARLDATTGMADSLDLVSANAAVFSVALQSDGKILVGGIFVQPFTRFGRLGNDIAAFQNLAVTQTSVTWTRGGSSPQFTRVTFEYSTDNVNYTPLGNGTTIGSNWTLSGLDLPVGLNFYVRARGHYRSGEFNGSESIAESVRNAFITLPAAQTVNLSTRMRVQTGDQVGIGGFIVTGSVPKHVLLRAIGPSLAQEGVPGALADPVLELHDPQGFVMVTSDNWRDDAAQEAAIIASGIPPTNDLESAIDATLLPGTYTAVVRGRNDTSGVALVEVYDLGQGVPARLANISTRAFASTGDSVVIAGFILGNHNGNDGVVVRGIGPSLSTALNPLADPTLELRDSNGILLASNNDWRDDSAQSADVSAVGLAPSNDREASIAAILPPGLYSAVLAGLNNGSGVGLVEIYDRGMP